jgi:hypothetical protein
MRFQDAFYELKFENAFLQARGNEFQTFFNRLMGFAYKADYIASRPWGKVGDKKNDGFLKSDKCLFQVYGPNELSESVAKRKITEDFEGALFHWKSDFEKWVFVHNSTQGLPPHVISLIIDFEKSNPGVKIDTWGLEELRLIFRKIHDEDKEIWLGFAPTEETKASLGFKDVQVVLENISSLPIPSPSNVRDVPKGKIEANSLSESVAILLKEGMIKSLLVKDFFSQWYDETLDERLAEAFSNEYKRLKEIYLNPNQIFSELQSWAGGNNRGSPEHELAVITVLAYYFESCDIFEEPREEHNDSPL